MLYTRQVLESIEDSALAPYGFRSQDSRGRAFPQDEARYRTCFQRDRDRILHTTPFRRLEYKTQVFVNYEGDYYRTRLTHTLEVAQIGRSLALALGANEDLVEAICLAHDLGHPPFGHAGEVMLNQLMADHGGFDHNKQSLRIVEKLERRYPDFDGLNLTWEVREGIVKHETEYDASDAGRYDPDKRGTLEAQLANPADELAYTAHDLDDGLRSGLIRPEDLTGIAWWERLKESLAWDGTGFDSLWRHRLVRRLLGLLVDDVIEADGVAHRQGRRAVAGRRPRAGGERRGAIRGRADDDARVEALPLRAALPPPTGDADDDQGGAHPHGAVRGVHRGAAPASPRRAGEAGRALAAPRRLRLHRRNDGSLRNAGVRQDVRSV